MRKIGNRIREARTRKGWSQQQLAERMSVTRGAISQWESGETELSLKRLSALAESLGTSEDWLRTGRDGTTPQPGGQPVTRDEWKAALLLAEKFSDQLTKSGQAGLDADQKIDLAERLAPYLAQYLAQ